MDSADTADLGAPNVPFFRMRRKPMKTTTIRKRRGEEEEEKDGEEEGEREGQRQQRAGENSDGSDASAEDDEGANASVEAARMKLVERRKHLRGRNLMHTTSKKRRKQIEDLAEAQSSEEGEGEADGQTPFDPDVKFSSSGTQRAGPSDMGATARSEVDTEYGSDAQAQFERIQEMLKKERLEREKREAEEEEDRKKYGERAKRRDEPSASQQQPKIYRGMAVYGAKEREDTIKGNAASGLNRLGPIRAQQYMRASVRWDYAPDICKDYKETGFCTFGDSCKFMHDRTDYKHGWEIERDWEAGKLKEATEDEFLVSSGEEGGEEEEDKLPHSCFICREHFRQPVVTKCRHYFCEDCALKHYQRSKKCAICGEKTDGVFNVAREILAKIKARDAAKAKKGDGDELDDPNDEGTEEAEPKTLPMAEEAGETVEKQSSEESSDE